MTNTDQGSVDVSFAPKRTVIGRLRGGIAAFVYPLLLVGTGLMAMAASIWHLPSTAALSHHFAHRRGTALSFHGIGGNIGDVVGPVTTGALLAVLSWREILSIYAAVPLFLAFAVYWAFKDIGRSGDQHGQAPDLGDHIAMTRTVLRNRALWGITLVAGLRGMAFVALMTFLPLYLDDELGMSVVSRGLHIGLLVAIGVVATPAMGYLSDRFGRKLVLVPGLVWLSLLTALLAPFGQGVTLTFLIALLGLFLYSDQPILTALALDIVGEGVVTTTLGALSFSRFVLSAASPLIAGGLYQTLGMDATFLYVAAILALAAATLAVLPIPARSHVATVDSAGHQDS